MVRHSRRASVPFKEFAEKRTRKLEAERQAELQRLQQMKSEMLETELQNKNNELTLQTTALVKRNEAIQALLEELDKQKETLGDRYPNKLYTRLRSFDRIYLERSSGLGAVRDLFLIAPTRISWIVYASNTQI